ncbi:MAG: lamin tail domain-containing protein [Akkermansiaceae bacterium]
MMKKSITINSAVCPPDKAQEESSAGITHILGRFGCWFMGFFVFLGFSAAEAQIIVISEFMASNQSGLLDEDGDDEDWIEIYNPGSSSIDLTGWHLTDDSSDLTKWTFPAVTLSPAQSLVVFASDKNRKVSGAELHTNFKLSTSGEYLGIVRPDGVTIEQDYGPTYPIQVTNVSYGLKQEVTEESLTPVGSDSTYLVPSNGDEDVRDGANLDSWIGTTYDDSSWTTGPTPHGFGASDGDQYYNFIETDLREELYAKKTTVYIRIPFQVDDPSVYSNLVLRMNYDDGFVAYLNGDPEPIAESNSPSSDVLDFDSVATSSNSDSNALAGEDFVINTTLLNVGQNVLCIHGLNRVASNSDALFVAELLGSRVTGSLEEAYFTNPTPGEANSAGDTEPGPVIRTVTDELAPIDPAAGGLVIESDIVSTLNPVTSVTLSWRIMYGSETDLTMVDDGSGSDSVAADGIYTAMIPTDDLSAGQMLRWKVTATDSSGVDTDAPPYPDSLDSPQYYGTIAEDSSVASSNLPVIHWFTSSPSGAETNGGSRGSIYYLGEFYDNIKADRHGQSTGGFPKKSFDLDFNKGDRFLPYEGGMRAKDINLITNWADKSKTRNTIGYEIMRMAEHPAHYSFPVRVQQNGQFFSTADLIEDGDDRYLERVNLDGEGALYKMYNRLDSSSSGVNKKTRKDENNSDLAALVSGLGLSGEAKLRYGYDNMNIAGLINYLAALDMTNNRDHGHKNYYIYRDTNETGEWRPLVWDIDLCLGRNWRSGPAYFDDVFGNNNLRAGPTNRMKQLVFNDSVLNDMFRRRVRTLMDQMYGSPAAPVDYLSTRVNELVNLLDPNDSAPASGGDDADLDYQKWGSWGNRNAMRPAADRILNEYIPTKRAQLYGLGELPEIQPAAPSIDIGVVDFNPANSGATADQSGEYFVLNNPNNFAVDCSGWEIAGGIFMTLPAGTVIPQNGSLYVGREAVGFRARSISPRANEKRYLVSGYQGQLSARGETITLTNHAGTVIDTVTFPGDPTPAQSALRVAEILYAPAAPTDSELDSIPSLSASDFEFIELVNTGSETLDLGGVQFTDGVTMTFGAGIDLLAGERLLVVANQAAFGLRFGAGLPVAGEFAGSLSNSGESIQIIDAVGENVLEFSYDGGWFPMADDQGHSLVVLDPVGTAYNDFDLVRNWGVSQTIGGDPGAGSITLGLTYQFWKYQNFTDAQLDNPLISGDDADLDGDSLGTLFEYALGLDPSLADEELGYAVSIEEVEGVERQVMTYQTPFLAVDLVVAVEACGDLVEWDLQSGMVEPPADNGDGTMLFKIFDSEAVSNVSKRFIRLRVQVTSSN